MKTGSRNLQQIVMTAILLTTGPVSSRRMVSKNRLTLRKLKREDFRAACKSLQELGFGYMTTDMVMLDKDLERQIFVKFKPDNVAKLLEANEDLCVTSAEYMDRYYQPSSKDYLSNFDREWLVRHGHVKKYAFSGVGLPDNTLM